MKSLIRRYLVLPLVCLVPLIAAAGQESPAPHDSLDNPTASAGTDAAINIGQFLTFFGAASSPDDEIRRYTWDFDGDGTADFTSAQTGYAAWTFDRPGRYQSLLTVEDSAGRTASGVRRVTVIDPQAAPTTDHAAPTALPEEQTQPDGIRRIFAVVLNGGYDERYWKDAELAYDMLNNGYGIPQTDIYLLNYDGKNPSGLNPGGMIDYPAKVEYIERVFSELAARTDADDELIFLITGHGYGYNGPLSQGGEYYGYNSGRISIDPGDEPDFPESDFKLRSLFTGGDYRANHGMNIWTVRKKYAYTKGTEFYRNKFVSAFNDVYIDQLSDYVSDDDVYIERFVDYALGDTNRDGYINTAAGEVFDFDGDGRQPYDHATGTYDEDDWGPIDKLEDNYNNAPCTLPEGGYPYKLFDAGLEGKICIDLAYAGGEPQIDGRDEDGEGLFDWMDVNRDGDTNDIISIDESLYLAAGVIYDDQLAVLLDGLHAAKITTAALPCFSGGLVEDLTGPGRIVCAATAEDAVSWGDAFFRGFVAALHKKNEYGSPVDADTNANGHISMLEAFNYSAAHDYYDETPQYDDNADGLSHTDPVPAGGDGPLGCVTYMENFNPFDLAGPTGIDFTDYAEFAAYWRYSDCDACGGADFTCDARVDPADLLRLAAAWLSGIE
ncbi:MAG: PKD domain-containing protein [Sedimentisphaerales bacterium]|nr:PKD domain-containing protein [Sedimentisphaerales bacterium]